MTLQAEIQLDAISQVPEEHRFLQVDSTAALVKITKHMNRHYKIFKHKISILIIHLIINFRL